MTNQPGLALLTLLAISAGPAFAQDYRAEIITNVIDPCYLAIIRNQESVEGISESQMLELLKLMQKESLEETVNSVLPVVEGKNLEFRTSFYKLGLVQCVQVGTES